MILLRKIILCVVLTTCYIAGWAQANPPAAAPAAASNANKIPTDTLTGNFIKLHLEKKNYIVNEVISITDSLIVDPGANIQLGNNVTLVCLGAVIMNGDETNRIKVTSRRGQVGTGMVIATQSQFPINIKYTNFDSLVMPLTFVDGWFRPQVLISNTQFIRNQGTTAVIQVLNPVVPVSDVSPVTNFRITNSLFANNIAPVRFEDLQSDFLKIEISNNTFVGNRIPGYGGVGNYTFSSNVLWGRMDKMQSVFKAVIKDNSFVANYLSDINADTLVRQANIGIYGSADSLNVPNNYWGTDNEAEARKKIYDFSTNLNNPKFILTPIAYGPSDTLPPHVYDISAPGRQATEKRMLVGDKWMLVKDSATTITYNYNLRQGLRVFKMVSNRPLLTRLMSLHFIYLKDNNDSLKTTDSTISLGSFRKDETEKNTIKLTFGVGPDSLFRSRPGYLVIKGLEGQKGEYVQEVTIGYESFLKYVYSKKPQNNYNGRGGSDSNLARIKLPPVITIPYKKKYELGLVAGNAIYYGTLSNRNLFANDYNSMFGVQFRYNHKKNFSISLSYLSLTLTGSDLRSGDTAKVHRGMSFKTPVTTISVQFEYDFFDHTVFSTKYRLHPMIGFGLDNISFTPMGEYQGKFIPLQPLGTGGQNIPDTSTGTNKRSGPYALSSLGAPVTMQLRYYLNKKTIFSIFATYHFAFTNYLDDVGPDPYPTQADLKKNTPADLQEAAIYFSNPTNRYVRTGQLRSGASDVSDGFFTFGFTLMHHF